MVVGVSRRSMAADKPEEEASACQLHSQRNLKNATGCNLNNPTRRKQEIAGADIDYRYV